jgi:hypothetical protein
LVFASPLKVILFVGICRDLGQRIWDPRQRSTSCGLKGVKDASSGTHIKKHHSSLPFGWNFTDEAENIRKMKTRSTL